MSQLWRTSYDKAPVIKGEIQMSSFNPYHYSRISAPTLSAAIPAESVHPPCPTVQPYYGAAPGFLEYYGQPQISEAQIHILRHGAEKALDVQADAAKQRNLSTELERRQVDRVNIAVAKDALGTEVRREGSALVYSKKRIAKPNLDLLIFSDCKSALFQQVLDPGHQILGISVNKSPWLFLASENWDDEGFGKLLMTAGVSLELSRNNSRRDVLKKALALLIQEAKQRGAQDVPVAYGWYGSGDQFRRISRSRGDIIWRLIA